MRVKYQACKFSDLPPILQEFDIFRRGGKYPEDIPTHLEYWGISELKHNEEYEVIAVETWPMHGKYITGVYLVPDLCPTWYPLDLFQIIDRSVRPDWEIAYEKDETGYLVMKRMTFPEWAHDDVFFEHLIDTVGDASYLYHVKIREYQTGCYSFLRRLAQEQETKEES